MKPGLRLVLPLIAAALLLSACQLQSTTEIKPDGSGELRTEVGFTAQERQNLEKQSGGSSSQNFCNVPASQGQAPSDITVTEEQRGEETWCVTTTRFDSLMESFIATDLEGTLTAAEGWKSVRRYLEERGRGAVFRRFFIGQLPRVYLNRVGWLDTQTLRNRWMADMASVFRGWSPDELAEAGDWMAETDLWPQRREGVLAEITPAYTNRCRCATTRRAAGS